MFASLFLLVLGSCFCSTESVLGRPRLFGPSEALVKSVVEFQCELLDYPKNESILLQLFKKGNRDKLLAEYTILDTILDEDPEDNATFPLKIKLDHEGHVECVARAQNNSNIRPTVSSPHYLRVVQPVTGAELVSSGPTELFEGEPLKLHCKVTGNHVSYKWLLNGSLLSVSRYDGENLLINRTTSKDSGFYMCVASNHFTTTVFTSNSSEVVITVKDLVSAPDISFTVIKEGINEYSAAVTCQSLKGTPPITFSLYNGTEVLVSKTTEERIATFNVPLVFDRHLGFLRCRANNGDWVVHSEEIPLQVEQVGGPVEMTYDYDIGENYAVIGLRFYCKAAKGSFPRYQWFLNKTLLHDRGSFYYVVHEPPQRSVLLLAVGGGSTGTYHCQVSDSFDNTTAVSSSKRWYLDREVLNRVHILVVAVVFGCFTLVLLLVSVCCCIGVLFRRSQYGEKSLFSLEMKSTVAAYEGELEESEYCQEAELLETVTPGEFDQASEASEDEWTQTEKKSQQQTEF